MSSVWAKDRATPFYRASAVMALVVAVAGFYLTYLQPMVTGEFGGPRWSHVHGATLLAWLILLILQTQLVGRSIRLHRTLGWLALLIAPAVVLTTVAIALESTSLAVANGQGAGAYSGFLGSITASLIFLALVLAAVWLRGDPQWHKRLIFIATVAVLWPAWFRWRHFLPFVPRPEFTLALILADAPLILAMIRDRVRYGAVHPAYLWVGTGLIIEQTAELAAFDGHTWRAAAGWAYRLLS